jgi:septum formation topological specificity factor MinE
MVIILLLYYYLLLLLISRLTSLISNNIINKYRFKARKTERKKNELLSIVMKYIVIMNSAMAIKLFQAITIIILI